MTKTLTEQWRKGTLTEGYYYTKGAFDDDIYISHLDYEIEEDKRLPVEEVLAPVPSYDEYKELVFKANMPKNPVGDTIMCYDTERERAVVEKLQEQISEANKLILWCARISWTGDQREDIFDKYLAKWGVK